MPSTPPQCFALANDRGHGCDVVNGIKYSSKSFVYVAKDASIRNRESRGTKTFEKDWVARILEIRASDKHHVYARVCWMYWPDELPEHTMDGKKILDGSAAVSRRQ